MRQGHDPGLDFFGINAFEQWVGFDLGLNAGHRKLTLWNRSNDAVMIACWFQENGNGTRHDDGVQNRLVAIAIDHHHITGRHSVVPDHFVGCAGAIGHKETMVCIENAGCVAFAFTDGAIVV